MKADYIVVGTGSAGSVLTPEELDGREIYWPRGKMLGGTSSTNAMMWVRGFAADYDERGEPAGEQWNFAKWSAGDLGAAFTAQLHRCLAEGCPTRRLPAGPTEPP